MTTEIIKQEIQPVLENLEENSKLAATLCDADAVLQEIRDENKKNADKITISAASYRDVLRNVAPATQTSFPAASANEVRIKAHVEIQAHQVLIDSSSTTEPSYSKKSCAEIATLINSTVSTATIEEVKSAKTRTVTKLGNGGILVELTHKKAANWLRTEDGKTALISKLGVDIIVRNRSFPIVVPFVSIDTDLDDPKLLREIEETNDLSLNSISKARWIKNPERRDAKQEVASIILSLVNPEPANHLILHGVQIRQKRVAPWKDAKDPIRCMKCQHYGHVAKDCHATHDTCVNCAGQHRTNECRYTRIKR